MLRKSLGLRIIKQFFDLAALDRGELLEKVVNASAPLKVIKQRHHGDSRTSKNRRAAKNIRIGTNDVDHVGIIAQTIQKEKKFLAIPFAIPHPLSVPLVLGTPGMRGSVSMAIRNARAVALKIASLMW